MIFAILVFGTYSCKEEMAIDPFLKAHSKKFGIETEGKGWQSKVKMGHFSTYDKPIGTAWMNEAGLMQFFNNDQLITFASTNNDNYTYDHILSETRDSELLRKYAEKFNMPLEVPGHFVKAYVGYLYASHDEYAMACVRENESTISAFLTNGYDTYEILPVLDASGSNQLIGYQVRLYDEYVGALQIADGWSFRMTTEYCDATEIILASIASMLVKCETSNS